MHRQYNLEHTLLEIINKVKLIFLVLSCCFRNFDIKLPGWGCRYSRDELWILSSIAISYGGQECRRHRQFTRVIRKSSPSVTGCEHYLEARKEGTIPKWNCSSTITFPLSPGSFFFPFLNQVIFDPRGSSFSSAMKRRAAQTSNDAQNFKPKKQQ